MTLTKTLHSSGGAKGGDVGQTYEGGAAVGRRTKETTDIARLSKKKKKKNGSLEQ